MASRYGPGVLPGYYGGDPGAAIADALGTYIEGKRQQRFDDLAAKGQELDLYRGGYRPDAPLPDKPAIDFSSAMPSADEVAAAIGNTPMPKPAPRAGDFEPDGGPGERAAFIMDMNQRAAQDPNVEPDYGPAEEAAYMMQVRQRAQRPADAALPMRDAPPVARAATAVAPPAAALARAQATQFFKLANGGYYVPGASEQDRRISEQRQYQDRVRGEENQREDQQIVGERQYRDRVRTEDYAHGDRQTELERAAREAQQAANREFETQQARARYEQERGLIGARGAEARRTDDHAASLKSAAEEAAGVHDAGWEERRSSAVSLLGKPLTALQQDIVNALAEGETPDRILGYLQQQGTDTETLAAARLYLSAGSMGYRGHQSGQF